MSSLAPGSRILHLGSDPSETALLAAELRSASIPGAVVHVSTSRELRAFLAADDVALVVADLPLPYASASAELAELQRTHPELRAVFRTGSAGNRSVADSVSQTVRAVQEALQHESLDPERREEHRRLVEQLVANHAVQLRLSRRDLWDFEASLRDITESGAELLGVARVSVWEVEPTTQALRCVLVYDRTAARHVGGQKLALPSSYVAALESAMFVAVDDAQNDPRTSAFARDYLSKLGITSLLDAPVRRDGRIVGVLCHEHTGPLRHWTILEQCTAAALAEIVARALEVRDRRRAEARLRESEKFEAIGRFTGRLAHDFNNLLTVILGNAQLALARQDHEPADRETLEQIAQASEDATALIRQLLAYSRREPARPSVIDLRAQIVQVLPMMERLLGADVRVVLRLGTEPRWVRIDPTQLQQVLLNLAANSRDALPGGGEFQVELAREPRAGPVAADGCGFVHLGVHDDGAGIPPEILPRIFEPFFTTKELRLGSGLGLASVREIVRAAGGEVEVASAPGAGTTFDITLPASPEPESTSTGARGQGGAGSTALVVSADPAARAALAATLQGLGAHAVEATGAVEALEVLARGTHFDWLVTAQALPKMEGARLIRHLRDFRPRLPAVLVVAPGSAPDPEPDPEIEALRLSGPTGVLTEPVAAAALAGWMGTALATK